MKCRNRVSTLFRLLSADRLRCGILRDRRCPDRDTPSTGGYGRVLSGIALVTCVFVSSFTSVARAADDAEPTYELQYKFAPGEAVRYQVEHRATVDTKIDGKRDVSKSRSVSTKVLEVQSVIGDVIKFKFLIDDVDMWQQANGQDEIRYDSTADEEVPAAYQQVASNIGKTLAVVTMNTSGKIIKRQSDKPNPDLGFGGLIFPLPTGPISVGHTWSDPKTLQLKERDGRVKQVKIQVRHELEKVSLGVATISVKTEVLTPISSATLKSQLVQQLSNGTLRFDLDAGRVLSKQMDWDETVIGFNGPSSNMKYLAKFTEQLLDTQTASKSRRPVK